LQNSIMKVPSNIHKKFMYISKKNQRNKNI
jgi:hypothetical protein